MKWNGYGEFLVIYPLFQLIMKDLWRFQSTPCIQLSWWSKYLLLFWTLVEKFDQSHFLHDLKEVCNLHEALQNCFRPVFFWKSWPRIDYIAKMPRNIHDFVQIFRLSTLVLLVVHHFSWTSRWGLVASYINVWMTELIFSPSDFVFKKTKLAPNFCVESSVISIRLLFFNSWVSRVQNSLNSGHFAQKASFLLFYQYKRNNWLQESIRPRSLTFCS